MKALAREKYHFTLKRPHLTTYDMKGGVSILYSYHHRWYQKVARDALNHGGDRFTLRTKTKAKGAKKCDKRGGWEDNIVALVLRVSVEPKEYVLSIEPFFLSRGTVWALDVPGISHKTVAYSCFAKVVDGLPCGQA